MHRGTVKGKSACVAERSSFKVQSETHQAEGVIAMTPTYKRNLGLILIIINTGYLMFALVSGRMEGLGSLPGLFTGWHDVPTTFGRKPWSFIFGFVAHAACLAIGIKLFREAGKEGA